MNVDRKMRDSMVSFQQRTDEDLFWQILLDTRIDKHERDRLKIAKQRNNFEKLMVHSPIANTIEFECNSYFFDYIDSSTITIRENWKSENTFQKVL